MTGRIICWKALSATVAAAGLLFAALPAWASPDDSVADWLKARLDRFPTFAAAQPAQTAAIAAIKADTASLVAAAGPLQQTALARAPVIWQASAAPVVILDDPVAPRMVVVPAGEFTMGSPTDEPGRLATEGPQRRVRIAHPLAVSMFAIVYGEFAEFLAATRYRSSAPCVTFEDGGFAARKGRDWNNPGVPATPRDAARCVSFEDATAYTAWLSKKTGHAYRLLSEAEYEYINRAGTTTAFWWGRDAAAGCAFANGFDLDAKPYAGAPAPIACHDGAAGASRVGTLKPNGFGLFDTSGNVASWTADCWNARLSAGPTDGSARMTGACRNRVLRGGSWASVDLRAARRDRDRVDAATAYYGFRVARAL